MNFLRGAARFWKELSLGVPPYIWLDSLVSVVICNFRSIFRIPLNPPFTFAVILFWYLNICLIIKKNPKLRTETYNVQAVM